MRRSLLLFMVAGAMGLSSTPANAQLIRGGETRLEALATADELTLQSDLWVMDVYYKPMRQIQVEITDPKTGDKKLEYVWYITYRAFNRQLLNRKPTDLPQNEFDPPVKPPIFLPEFTLVTTVGGKPQVTNDTVCPEALAAINLREKGRYRSSVDVVSEVPAASDLGSANRRGIEGVAIFRGINPDADRYTVYLTGFSNGVKVGKGADGTPVTLNKTIVQKYWRPGDRFDRNEAEILVDGNAEWIYR